MKFSKLALAAIVLWLVTVAVFGWFFVHGRTATGTDNRSAVLLAPGERSLILSEMRNLLSGVHDILDSLNHNDLRAAADAARASGTASAADVNPALMAKLPLPFKQLGMSVHRDMDDLAKAAESGKPSFELQTMLSSTLAKCVACHAAWQLKAAAP